MQLDAQNRPAQKSNTELAKEVGRQLPPLTINSPLQSSYQGATTTVRNTRLLLLLPRLLQFRMAVGFAFFAVQKTVLGFAAVCQVWSCYGLPPKPPATPPCLPACLPTCVRHRAKNLTRNNVTAPSRWRRQSVCSRRKWSFSVGRATQRGCSTSPPP